MFKADAYLVQAERIENGFSEIDEVAARSMHKAPIVNGEHALALTLHVVVAAITAYFAAIETAEQALHVAEREHDAVLEVRSAVLAEKAEFDEELFILFAKTRAEGGGTVTRA